MVFQKQDKQAWVQFYLANKDYQFEVRKNVLDELDKLTRAEMIRFVIDILKPRTANRLVMHATGTQHDSMPPLHIGLEIDSIDEFHLRPKDTALG